MRQLFKLLVLISGVSIIVGLSAAGFNWMVKGANHLFFGFFGNTEVTQAANNLIHQPYILLLPAIGGLLTGLFLHFVGKGAKPGVPDVIARVEKKGSKLPVKSGLLNAVASSLTIGSGGSAGTEGTIIQIGSAFGSGVGGWFKLSRDELRTLLGCGAAAGFGALFGTPIAGIFFVMEVLLREMNARRLALIAFATLIGYSVSEYWLNISHVLVLEPVGDQTWNLLPFYLILGALAAPFGVSFSLLTLKVSQFSGRLKVKPWLKPALGGLLVGLIGLFVPRIFGVGEDHMQQAILGGLPLLLLLVLAVAKVVATSVTIGSGGAGGIFVPSMFIGAMVGSAFGLICQFFWPDLVSSPQAFAAVGMGTVLATVVSAPLTGILLIVELSREMALLPGAVAAVAAAVLVSGYLHPQSMYILQLVAKGINRPPISYPNPLAHVFVHQHMQTSLPILQQSMTVGEVRNQIQARNWYTPVTDSERRVVGVLSSEDIKGKHRHRLIADFIHPTTTTATIDETLHDVLRKPAVTELPIIPVVDNNNRVVATLDSNQLIKQYST